MLFPQTGPIVVVVVVVGSSVVVVVAVVVVAVVVVAVVVVAVVVVAVVDVAVVVVAVVVVAVVVVAVVLVVVVVGGSQASSVQVPPPMFVPPASMHSAGLSSWHVIPSPGTQQRISSAHPPVLHASQQTSAVLTQELPWLGALHFDASRTALHRVLPLRSVRQHVTQPGRPQTDFREQARASRTHCFGRRPLDARAAMTSRVHCTQSLWLSTPAQSHSA
jgi:hypothetical protein